MCLDVSYFHSYHNNKAAKFQVFEHLFAKFSFNIVFFLQQNKSSVIQVNSNLFMYKLKKIFVLVSHCSIILLVWFSEICWYHRKSKFGFIRSIILILMVGNKIFFRKPNSAESCLKNRIPFYVSYEDDIFHYSINLKAV